MFPQKIKINPNNNRLKRTKINDQPKKKALYLYIIDPVWKKDNGFIIE